MKLDRMDLEMLPAWVGENDSTISFFEWLMEETAEPWSVGAFAVAKVLQGDFYFLYGRRQKTRVLNIGGDLAFLGIFHRHDCGLYDLKEPMREILELPETLDFPDKAEALKEAENMASQKAFQMTEKEWEEILRESGCEKEELLPRISKSEILKCAEEYYRAGKKETEICFRPKVPVSDYFSDHCYLLYLTRKEWVAQKIARQWLLENAAVVSRQRIRFGCIRNEYREIKAKMENRKIKKYTTRRK